MSTGSLGKIAQILQKGLILLIRGYQYFISPLLGARCRFYPSCSQYALEALQHYKLLKGCYLIFRRLIRCHPFCAGGYDPLVHSKDCAVTQHNLNSDSLLKK